MNRNTSPNALLAQVSLGDRNAFAQLYQQTSAKLFAISLRITQQEALSEEALQDAFVTVWQRAAQFDPDKAQAITWIGTIVRNRSIDLLRHNRKQNFQDDLDDDSLVDHQPTPDLLAISQEQAQAVHLCLGELNAQQQTAIKLAYLHGYTRAEIARHQNVPVGSVKTWIHRGVKKMKACLNRVAQGENQ